MSAGGLMTQDIFEQFVTLWVVVDPIGTIPVFVAVTAGIEASQRPKIAFRATLAAAGVLIFFLVFGQFLIDALGISLPAFQIAGSLVLFLFALTMIFGDSKPQVETQDISRGPQQDSPAVFPLAVPSLASPGAMLAIVLLTDNNRFSVPEQVVSGAIMLSVLAVAFLLMLTAGPILKVIKVGGAAIVSRVMGIILAALAVDNIINAIIELLRTTKL
jgi:multiple antibiotic resistance protein